jgi:hypothetical protein
LGALVVLAHPKSGALMHIRAIASNGTTTRIGAICEDAFVHAGFRQHQPAALDRTIAIGL